MSETLYRYPGAQPFRDDELSRQTFFGREHASAALTDQILANRLLIVYAKSGLGKTSLLNAGIAPRLRDAGSLPLFVRVNDTKRDILSAILEEVNLEAARQAVEFTPGDGSSLWSFFKTVEFWRDDLLQSPVLIIDQFEELFTLQAPKGRERFLEELGCLLRGVPPAWYTGNGSAMSDCAPVIRVVLSLREDFVGLLEEASDRIPEIMDHRYRLAPLTLEMAAKAIIGPAAIEHENIATKAFRLEPECVESILSYLTQTTSESQRVAARHVEPFHLQLICQRIESIAAYKQKAVSGQLVLSFQDIGGRAALAETLENFYVDAIRSLPRRFRRAARRMCERVLISSEGRRLSLEERELCRELRLPREMLNQLTERRLLRTDRRSESTYYELSHDALVQPVLASRRAQTLLLYGTTIFAGSIAYLLSGALIVVCVAGLITANRDMEIYLAAAFLLFIALVLGFLGMRSFRAATRRRSRYEPVAIEAGGRFSKLRRRTKRALGWMLLVAGPGFCFAWALAGSIGLFQYSIVTIRHGRVPEWAVSLMAGSVHEAMQLMQDHPITEMGWWVIEHGVIVLFGWSLIRRGDQMIWPRPSTARSKPSCLPGVDKPPSLVRASIKMLAGVIGLSVTALGLFTVKTCASSWHGSIPYWLSWPVSSYKFSDVCQTIYQKGWDWSEFTVGMFLFSALALSIATIYSGALDTRLALRYRRESLKEPGFRQGIILGVSACILAVVTVLGVTLSRIPHSDPREAAKMVHARAATRQSSLHFGWASGEDATILHTEDDGNTWISELSGTGSLNEVAFATRYKGWVVGAQGTIWHSDNGGGKWDVQHSGVHQDLIVVRFVTPRKGWVVGNEGVILHTEDEGNHWVRQVSDTAKGLVDIAFANPNDGWAVGQDGTIQHTTDGGKYWVAQESGTKKELTCVAFPTPLLGWAGGNDGTILHTENGGDTWKAQSSGTIRDLTGLAFVDSTTGWAIGRRGTVLHTEDGGKTWRPQESHSRADLHEVSFVTPAAGWAASDAGVILHTEDGGRIWAAQTSGTRSDLQSINFLKPYGVIGVTFKTASVPESAQHPSVGGVLLEAVDPAGPSSAAGLKAADILTAVNAVPVKTQADVVDAIYPLKPGTSIHLTFLRQGKRQIVNLMVADGSKPFEAQARP
jgi:photosystem II stability/assembly factor-like uncharacterized protein